MYNKKIKITSIIFLTFIVSLLLLTAIHPTFRLDESFTMGVVSHSYKNIIYLNTMDVHPPFYYLLLKAFLDITTFWTSSVLIKVMFARTFSFITFLLFCYFGNKIYEICSNKKISWGLQLILLLLIPSILQDSIRIRMYSLSALFLIIELYELIKFDKFNKRVSILVAIFCVILNAYTFYFGALTAGLYLFIFSLYYLKCRKIKKFFILSMSEILVIIMYIPWIPIVLHQFKSHSGNDNGTNYNYLYNIMASFTQLSNIVVLDVLVFLLLISIFAYVYVILNKRFKIIFLINVINYLLTLIIVLITCKNNFQNISCYPIFTIMVSLSLVVLIRRITIAPSKINVIFKIIVISFLSLLILDAFKNIYSNVKTYDVPTITLVKNLNEWENSNKNYIIINKRNYPISKQMTASEDAVYLLPVHKKVIVKNYNYQMLSKGLLNDNHNVRLLKSTFNNLYVRN